MRSGTTAAIATACLMALALAAHGADAPKSQGAKPTKAADAPKADAPAQGVKPAGPKLQMDAPAKNPGKDRDMRHCLDLPTAKEIIRCSEKS